VAGSACGGGLQQRVGDLPPPLLVINPFRRLHHISFASFYSPFTQTAH
jgi:hypothetical protein